MEKEINYPVKYAILKLEALGDRGANYANITYGFIASKCYIVEKNINYGTNKKTYKVVFPYNDIKSFINSSKDIFSLGPKKRPSYDKNGELLYYTTVTQIFDTFEEAKELASNLRHDYQFVMKSQNNLKLTYTKLIRSGLDLNEKYENLIELSTSDMIVTENLDEKENDNVSLFI